VAASRFATHLRLFAFWQDRPIRKQPQIHTASDLWSTSWFTTCQALGSQYSSRVQWFPHGSPVRVLANAVCGQWIPRLRSIRCASAWQADLSAATSTNADHWSVRFGDLRRARKKSRGWEKNSRTLQPFFRSTMC